MGKRGVEFGVLFRAGITLALALAASPGAAETNLDVALGYRRDALQWSIAAPGGSPNVLSEFSWSGIEIAQLRLAVDRTTAGGLHLRGSLGYGWIVDGRNQDSDYLGDNRTLEFSRSNNDTDDDNVLDVSVAAGYRVYLSAPGARDRQWLIPLVGYDYREQNLRIINGNQTIPATGSFAGLDSTYRTEWNGPWVGVEWAEESARAVNSHVRVSWHRFDYYGEGNWNLRTDLAHPRSFAHYSDGSGWIVSAGFSSAQSATWRYRVSYDYLRWRAGAGVDRVFPATGGYFETGFNETEWRSSSLNLSLWRQIK